MGNEKGADAIVIARRQDTQPRRWNAQVKRAGLSSGPETRADGPKQPPHVPPGAPPRDFLPRGLARDYPSPAIRQSLRERERGHSLAL